MSQRSTFDSTSKNKERNTHFERLYKTKLCRYIRRQRCPKGENCTFAHTFEELWWYQNRLRLHNMNPLQGKKTNPPPRSPASQNVKKADQPEKDVDNWSDVMEEASVSMEELDAPTQETTAPMIAGNHYQFSNAENWNFKVFVPRRLHR